MEALKSNCAKKYDGIVEGISWLNKIYKKDSHIWSDLDLKILRNNVQMSVWEMSKILDRRPSSIYYRKNLL